MSWNEGSQAASGRGKSYDVKYNVYTGTTVIKINTNNRLVLTTKYSFITKIVIFDS